MPTAPAPTELPTIPGGWTEQRMRIAGRAFQLTRPARPDAFLDDPQVLAEHQRDGFMPYWAYLWPAARTMAQRVLSAQWTPGTRVLELGAGIGLVGLAGLSCGLRVTFSDYRREVIDLTLHNARQNGFTQADGLLLDWRDPPDVQYPVVFGCDVIYEIPCHEPILSTLQTVLDPHGFAWLADPGRACRPHFVTRARQRGFDVTFHDASGRRGDVMPSAEFVILELRRRC